MAKLICDDCGKAISSKNARTYTRMTKTMIYQLTVCQDCYRKARPKKQEKNHAEN